MVRAVRKRPEPLWCWIEANARLPRGIAAEPRPIKLHPTNAGIAGTKIKPRDSNPLGSFPVPAKSGTPKFQ
jgi:hypothetical protein